MEEDKILLIEKVLLSTERNRAKHLKHYEGFYSAESIDKLFADSTYISKHSQLTLDDGTNPHGTTQSDVGLSNVDNTSDADKPISTLTQTALDSKLDNTTTTITATQAAEITANTDKVSFPIIPFTTIVDLNDVSGVVDIDWSLGVKFKMNVIGNTTLTFSNYAAYEEVKAQRLEITFDDTYTVTFPTGVEASEIDPSLDTDKTNYPSFIYLGNTLFQASNYVR